MEGRQGAFSRRGRPKFEIYLTRARSAVFKVCHVRCEVFQVRVGFLDGFYDMAKKIIRGTEPPSESLGFFFQTRNRQGHRPARAPSTARIACSLVTGSLARAFRRRLVLGVI